MCIIDVYLVPLLASYCGAILCTIGYCESHKNLGMLVFLWICVIIATMLYMLRRKAYKVSKLRTALSELHEMPVDEWEAKWANYIQKEYNKVDDPHREEVESDMEFFRKCREELKEGDEQ